LGRNCADIDGKSRIFTKTEGIEKEN